MLISGVEGGVSGFFSTAVEGEKFKIANFHWDVTSSQIALWVIIVGALLKMFRRILLTRLLCRGI